MSERLLRNTPVSVIDFETTGLSARSGARIVEVAVARIEPGQEPRLVLDTLIDPEGPVLCTSIHGITDDDVLGAPRFSELLGELVLSLEGSVVGAFNASFDMSFLSAEARLAPKTASLRVPPHICFMWMRPLVGLSKRCSLDIACQQHGLRAGTHRAAEDALACAYMWQHYVSAAESAGWRTWTDLATAGSHKYLDTLNYPPYSAADFRSIGGEKCGTAKKPRREPVQSPTIMKAGASCSHPSPTQAPRAYWSALVDALADGQLDSGEIEGLMRLQRELGIAHTSIRDAHARLFADCIRICAEDRIISDVESMKLRHLREALLTLGWAPG